MNSKDHHTHVERLPNWLAFGIRADRWYRPVLFAVGLVVIIANIIVAFVHLDDRFNVTHVSGTFLALDWYADQGQLYAPLFEDGFYGGTRFSPLAILWNSLWGGVSDDPIVASKLAAFFTVAAMLVALFLCMRRIGAPHALSFVLTASVIVTEPGFVAVSAPFRGDPAPVVLQLVALLLIARPDRTMRHVAIAAVLCAVAVFFKLTAGFAIIAIGLFLLANDRRQLVVLCAVWFGLVIALFFSFDAITSGRYAANILGLSASNMGGLRAFLGTPGTMNYILMDTARVTWVGVPLGLVGVVRALNYRRVSLFQIAWLVCGALLLIMLSDSGVSFNHFLGFIAMTSLVVAELWVSFDRENAFNLRTDRALVLVALLWTVAGDFDRVVADEVRAAIRTSSPMLQIDVLREMLEPDDHLLSEDPYLPVLLDKRPVVVDAWMVTKLGSRRPELVKQLAARVDAAEFTKIILLLALDSPHAPKWYEQHFGHEVIAALQRRYLLKTISVGYYVWVPKPAG